MEEKNEKVEKNSIESDGKIIELEKKLKDSNERALRIQAEFENYQKRAARENEHIRETASAQTLLRILPIIDEFDIALSHMEKKKSHDAEGMKIIYAKLMEVLKKEGVEEIKTNGKFDPYLHEALKSTSGEEGKIIDVYQKGYLLKGKVLRHSKVAVGNGEIEVEK